MPKPGLKKNDDKKKKKKNYSKFGIYSHKVLKTIAPDVGISKKGMNVIDNII